MRKFFKEFKDFIKRGNVVDLAVGIIIGSAFTAIVTSLVNDMIMPLIGLVSKNGFDSMYLGIIKNGVAAADTTLKNGAVIAAGEPIYKAYLYYGTFIQAIINFLIIALVVFIIVKIINRARTSGEELRKKAKKHKKGEPEEVPEPEPVAPALTTTEQLLTDIKALLEKNK